MIIKGSHIKEVGDIVHHSEKELVKSCRNSSCRELDNERNSRAVLYISEMEKSCCLSEELVKPPNNTESECNRLRWKNNLVLAPLWVLS